MEMSPHCFSVRSNLIEGEFEDVWNGRTGHCYKKPMGNRWLERRTPDRRNCPCRSRASKQQVFVSAPRQQLRNFLG